MNTILSIFTAFGISLSCLANASYLGSNFVAVRHAPAAKIIVKPNYPPLARTKRAHGTVIVAVNIDSKGIVRMAKPMSGPSILRGTSQEAAMRWRFDPDETAKSMRRVHLKFIFRPYSYVAKKGESDFTAPYQISVSTYATGDTFDLGP